MELGLGDSTALPRCLQPRWQPALWPTLAVLALLSSVTEASLDPMSLSPSARDGPSPVLAPPTGHLPGRGTHCALVQRKSPATTATVSPARTPAARSRAPISSRCAPRGTRRACRDPEQPRAGHGYARLPPALAAGASERARPGPQLRRAGTFPLLQRLVPPSTLPARPQPGQLTGRRGPAIAPWVPANQPALLPAHSL
ncbi:artemin isoform X2 [Microtus ochrogaster]|uniref:Artemin isoform X2 n=1 Tax=Microtus ochrogaster TaxID=79684 RepID=A0ABM1AXQ0_MICOH|nr:artemin isoform X2 [Microtus ochrogaster]